MRLTTFDQRLDAWYSLREQVRNLSVHDTLKSINQWWNQVPWRPYYLHWDDLDTWPDPWDLLADNHFCGLAKALGIVYTIEMIGRPDITAVQIAENGNSSDNLVLVNDGKYILNWAPGELLNITSTQVSIKRSVDSQAVVKKIN
jgi:hypothetical protein